MPLSGFASLYVTPTGRELVGMRFHTFKMNRVRDALCALSLSAAMTACASSATPAPSPPVASAPAGAAPGRTNTNARAADTGSANLLPLVPAVNGAPLNPRVQYPSENQTIASRDSNFILGSVGSGDAKLTINGFPVDVAPNGAYIGWLPNPPASNPSYELVVTRGAETVRRTLRVKYPTRTPLLATGKLRVDSGSVAPSGRPRVRPDEMIRVSVRAPLNASAWLQLDTGRVQLSPASIAASNVSRMARGEKTLLTDVTMPGSEDVGGLFVTEIAAQKLGKTPRIIIGRGADTVRFNIAPPVVTDPMVRTVGVLRAAATFESDTDRVVIGRPNPEGTYKWLLMPGTIVEITGKQGGFTRVRLDSQLEVWVANDDIAQLPDGTPLSRRVSGGIRINPSKEWSDVIIPMGERAPFIVEPDGNKLNVTLYGTVISADISPIIGNDTLVRQMSWDQVASDRAKLELRLSQPVYGWLSVWDENRRALVIRVRRVPNINKDRPLQGMTIAVDPGHPPAGSTGPTGLFEGDAVLPVGELVAQMLKDKGAIPIMTRTTKGPVGLTERTVISRRANVNAFISIHLNAFGDGTNPFTNNGTSTLFFHQTGEPLARPVQRELMKRLGLRDLGVHYQNLAVARPTWYPSALAEGAFVIIPEQEAALRNPAYQKRYAEGLVAGLESYFRELGQR